MKKEEYVLDRLIKEKCKKIKERVNKESLSSKEKENILKKINTKLKKQW